jgi:hypothetical protein
MISDSLLATDRLARRKVALRFVLLIGVLSFFADFTYEGSRSILGPYLAALQASATAVAIVTGFGELLGYGLRLVSGRTADRTGQFWPITIVGDVVQMLSVPLLALASRWEAAATLISFPRPWPRWCPPSSRVGLRALHGGIWSLLVPGERRDRCPLRPIRPGCDRVLCHPRARGDPGLCPRAATTSPQPAGSLTPEPCGRGGRGANPDLRSRSRASARTRCFHRSAS